MSVWKETDRTKSDTMKFSETAKTTNKNKKEVSLLVNRLCFNSVTTFFQTENKYVNFFHGGAERIFTRVIFQDKCENGGLKTGMYNLCGDAYVYSDE